MSSYRSAATIWLLCDCAYAGGVECSKELKEWNKVNFQLSGMTLAAQVNISKISDQEMKGLKGMGLDGKALLAKPCSMQVVLLPFSEKDEPLLYKGKHPILLSFRAAALTTLTWGCIETIPWRSPVPHNLRFGKKGEPLLGTKASMTS